MPVVATTNPLHHGVGYGTPEGQRRALSDEGTAWARACIQSQLDLLSRGEWAAFARLAAQERSDFRDVGPVLAHLLRGLRGLRDAKGEILDLRLADYAEILGAAGPTWVAAPLMRVE